MWLRTERLEIRLPVEGDGEHLAHYFARNCEHLQPWYPRFGPDDFEPRCWEDTIPISRLEYARGSSVRTCLFREGALVGVVNVTSIRYEPRNSASLGYSLDANETGRGLMREALEALLPAVVEHHRLHRVEAAYLPRNERSGRLLASLGFQQEGLAREYLLINGAWEDHVLTAKIYP